MMALAPKIGRMSAHHLVEDSCKQAVKQQRHLLQVVQENSEITAQFSVAQLNTIFNPANYLGNIQDQIDQVIKSARSIK